MAKTSCVHFLTCGQSVASRGLGRWRLAPFSGPERRQLRWRKAIISGRSRVKSELRYSDRLAASSLLSSNIMGLVICNNMPAFNSYTQKTREKLYG